LPRQYLAFLIPFRTVELQGINAALAVAFIKPATGKHRAHRGNLVLIVQGRRNLNAPQVPTYHAHGLQHLEPRFAAAKLLHSDVLRQDMAAKANVMLGDEVFEQLDVMAQAVSRTFVIADQTNLSSDFLHEPDRGCVRVAEVPRREDRQAPVELYPANPALTFRLGHFSPVKRAEYRGRK